MGSSHHTRYHHICQQCGAERWTTKKHNPSGLCFPCLLLNRTTQKRGRDPERWRAYMQAYDRNRSKQRMLDNKRRRKEKPAQYRLAGRRRYAAKAEEMRAYNRQYYADHQEHITARERKLYTINGEHIRAYNRVWTKGHPHVTLRRKIRRRLREASSYIEDVSLDIVYKRDKGLCSLCHKHVTRKHASLDHIIPLAVGGKHSYRNVALAHLRCNARKQHRIATQQMRLF